MKILHVITSINPEAPALRKNAIKLASVGVQSIYIFDRKADRVAVKLLSEIEGVCTRSFGDEAQSQFEELVPFDTYSRKNIGYIHCAREQANAFETDDDNFLSDSIEKLLKPFEPVESYSGRGNLFKNFYDLPADTALWARGYPLVWREVEPTLQSEGRIMPGVRQYLIDGNPDVDAIYRLVRPHDHDLKVVNDFDELSIYNFTFPFNSQGTLWPKESLALAYIPTYTEFRMCDIWRGYVAQNILYKHKRSVVFDKACLYQARNEHDIAVDFYGEISGYKNGIDVIRTLSSVKFDSYRNMMIESYSLLLKLGAIYDARELVLLEAYLADIEACI